MIQPIIRNEEIASGTFLLAVERQHDFKPGETVKVQLNDQYPPRIYSICSGNREDELGILYNIKEEGLLTPMLAQAKPGDPIMISEPSGGFIGTDAPAFWIATGTGIAPFYSMLRSGMAKDKTLLHGVRRADQLYFASEWKKALGHNYHAFCSQEDADSATRGRVTGYLEHAALPPELKYYLCGKDAMCIEVRDLLIARGVPFGNIITEIYF